jgi:nitrate reductase gamma subunit
MTIFLVFPFTRLVHVFSAPIWYLGRRGYQVVRTRRRSAGERPAHAMASQGRAIPAGRSAAGSQLRPAE